MMVTANRDTDIRVYIFFDLRSNSRAPPLLQVKVAPVYRQLHARWPPAPRSTLLDLAAMGLVAGPMFKTCTM
eukprot:SAG22_NODE_366_length_11615_cov_13.379125_3_plen_72_part_00